MIPKECKMPDLSDLLEVRLQGRSMLHAMFLGDRGVTPKGRLYRRNFARLVDKALSEYQAARQAIIDQIADRERTYKQAVAEGAIFHILNYVDHFENCINAVNRLLRLFERLRSEPILADLPRTSRRSLEAHSQALPDVRNTFEHIDGSIFKGEIGEGEPVMLSISEDGERAVIGPYAIQFVDVARSIRRLAPSQNGPFDELVGGQFASRRVQSWA